MAELIEKLNAPIEEPIQPNGATVEEYLAKVAKASGVELVLDEEHFKAQGVAQPGETKISFLAPKGVRLHALLSLIGLHMAGTGDNVHNPQDRRSVLIRDGRLVLMTWVGVQDQQSLTWVDKPEEGTRWTLLTTVWVDAVDQTLSAVLRQLADSYEVNIVVTAGAATLAETRTTSRLLNAPLGTALEALAEQCGLAVFVKHNVIFVMTPEHARKAKQNVAEAVARQAARWGAPAAGAVRPALAEPTVDDKVVIGADSKPLRQVVSELTGAGFNITLDPAGGKKADAEITAKLNGVACEAAVKQLAELAGLRAVRLDNSLFITTPEKADKLAPPAERKSVKPKKGKNP